MIFFIIKVSDRGSLRFFIHFDNRNIVYVKVVNQILALRGDNDLCVYGRILDHFNQLGYSIGV